MLLYIHSVYNRILPRQPLSYGGCMKTMNRQTKTDLKLPRELPYRSRKLQTVQPSAMDWKKVILMLPLLLFFSMIVKCR